jgi:hypothetical protein
VKQTLVVSSLMMTVPATLGRFFASQRHLMVFAIDSPIIDSIAHYL